jgi:hypothetical protein
MTDAATIAAMAIGTPITNIATAVATLTFCEWLMVFFLKVLLRLVIAPRDVCCD